VKLRIVIAILNRFPNVIEHREPSFDGRRRYESAVVTNCAGNTRNCELRN